MVSVLLDPGGRCFMSESCCEAEAKDEAVLHKIVGPPLVGEHFDPVNLELALQVSN